MNKEVEEVIRDIVNFDESNWDENISDFEVAYNSAIHTTTGFAPFFPNSGTHPRTTPIETLASSNPAASDFFKNSTVNGRTS